MNTSVKCKHCGKEFEISEAIRHEIEEKIVSAKDEEFKSKLKQQEEQIKETILKEVAEKQKVEIENLERQQEEQKKKTEQIKQQELTLGEEKRKLEEKEKAIQSTTQKIIEEERKKNDEILKNIQRQKKEDEQKILEQATKNAADKYRLDKLEYEKKFADMQKALEDAQRKGKQGSQQLQGEVLELDLEEQLKIQFPYDEFVPIPKGVEGADIWQKVKDQKGNDVGSIVWETKRTKTWDKKWLRKLREDMGRLNASECILVSQILPGETKDFSYLERVWITNYEYALHVARVVSFMLRKVAASKSAMNHTDEELIKIREYISSDSFRHKINMHHDTINLMHEELTSEIRLTQVRWKKREAQIKTLDNNISQLDGEIQSILPDVTTQSLLTDSHSGKSEEDEN